VFSTTSEICTQAHSYPKQATYQNSQAIKASIQKLYSRYILLLNFKITQKPFGFRPDSINQSCSAKLLEHNKTSLTIFGFFVNFLWIFKVGWFEMGGSDFPQKSPWKDLNLCNWILVRATQGNRSVAIEFQRGCLLAV
jgi:hypothetical protein